MFLFLGIACFIIVFLACKYDEFGLPGLMIGIGLIAAFCLLFYLFTKTLMWDVGYYIIMGLIMLAGLSYLLYLLGSWLHYVFVKSIPPVKRVVCSGAISPVTNPRLKARAFTLFKPYCFCHLGYP